MKKLIVSAIAIAFATAIQAAQVSWALEKDSDKTYGNLTAYVINGSDYSAAVNLLTAGGADVGTNFLDDYVIDSVALNSRGAGGKATDGVTGDTLAWFIFADDKIEDGSSYSSTGPVNVSTYAFTPPQSSPGDFSFTVDSFTTKGAPVGAPEPTSGLMLLLGLAGLALKRKHA